MEIGKIGERKLIEMIRGEYSYAWSNSDSAYFDAGKKRILITNDSITKSTHMPEGADPDDFGYFFAAINLSDIAAMGGTPKYFMSSLILPSSLDSKYVLALERGIRRCLNRYDVKMIGGDTKKGRELALTGIAIGEVDKSTMMHRLRMNAGEALCVTGDLGKNAAGYQGWKAGSKDGAKMLLAVEPRIKEGKFLSKNGVKAAMDLSDGVYSVIHQLRSATGLGFEIFYDKIPVSPEALSASRRYGTSIEQLCLNFGGEYELVFSVKESALEKLRKDAHSRGIKITKMGRIIHGKSVLIKDSKRINISKYGYEHFITD
jgi:thiamine-monophosphate kinase